MPPRTIPIAGNGQSSVSFELPQSREFKVQTIYVEVDTTGGSATPTLTLADQSGVVIAKKAQSQQLSGGGPETATWALRLADEQASQQAQLAEYAAGSAATNPPFLLLLGPQNLPINTITTDDPAMYALASSGPPNFIQGIQVNKVGTYLFQLGGKARATVAHPEPNFATKTVTIEAGQFPGQANGPLHPGLGSRTRGYGTATTAIWLTMETTLAFVDPGSVGQVFWPLVDNQTAAFLTLDICDVFVQRISARDVAPA